MLYFPLKEVLHVGDSVEPPALPQHIGVLRQQGLVYDPPLVFGLFKMRVGEEKEHLTQLAFPAQNSLERA